MKKQHGIVALIVLIMAIALTLGAFATNEYMTATKAENPPIAMKITWHGESGQAQVYIRPEGTDTSSVYDGPYDFHNIYGSMYLPMRKICERLGEIVDWDPVLGRAYVVRGEEKIDMTGKLINGTTFIKIRDFEKLGYLVDYYVDEEGKPWATLFARPVYDAVNELKEYEEYVKYRDRLTNSYVKLTQDKELTVAYLGGSITVGANYTDHCWRTLIDEWFKSEFPRANIQMINAGMGGTGSTYGAYRMDTAVLPYKPDLVFVEFAVNDDVFSDGYGEFKLTREYLQEFYETIIRKVYAANPKADIVIVYTAKNGMTTRSPSIKAHEELAKYYNLNSVYFGQTLLDYIKNNGLTLKDYIFDGIHPTDKGYDVMVEPLKEMFANAWSGLAVTEAKAKALPEKLLSAHDRSDCYYILAKDTEYDGSWSGTSIMSSKTPGGTMSCKFTGDEVAVFAGISTKSVIIDYRIDGGEWQEQAFYGANVRERVLLASGLEPTEHTLEIRVSEKIKTEDTVQIYAVLIN